MERELPENATPRSSLPNSLRSLLYDRPTSATRGSVRLMDSETEEEQSVMDTEMEAGSQSAGVLTLLRRPTSTPPFPSGGSTGYERRSHYPIRGTAMGDDDDVGEDYESDYEPPSRQRPSVGSSSIPHGQPAVQHRQHPPDDMVQNRSHPSYVPMHYSPPAYTSYPNPNPGLYENSPMLQASSRPYGASDYRNRDAARSFDMTWEGRGESGHVRESHSRSLPRPGAVFSHSTSTVRHEYPHDQPMDESLIQSNHPNYAAPRAYPDTHRHSSLPAESSHHHREFTGDTLSLLGTDADPYDPRPRSPANWRSRSSSASSSHNGDEDDDDFEAEPPRTSRPSKRKKSRATEELDSPPPGERKRRMFKKTEIACEFCRGRKLRCDGAKPICSTCAARKNTEPCRYQPQPKRRGPGKAPKGARAKAAVDRAAQLKAEYEPTRTTRRRSAPQQTPSTSYSPVDDQPHGPTSTLSGRLGYDDLPQGSSNPSSSRSPYASTTGTGTRSSSYDSSVHAPMPTPHGARPPLPPHLHHPDSSYVERRRFRDDEEDSGPY